MTDALGTTRQTQQIVVMDAVGRWKHEMFSRWTFGDLLLVNPREIRAHLREAAGRTKFSFSPQKLAPGVAELNLPMPPGWLFPFMPLSSRVLAAPVRRFIGNNRWLLVLTLPQYHQVIDHLPSEGRTVAYYAYDDYAENWRGHTQSVEQAEREMGRKADIILCAAAHRLSAFTKSRAALSDRVHQLPVASPDEWLETLGTPRTKESLANRFPSPRFLSFGALTGRIDFQFFAAVARRFPSGSVILAGSPPVKEGGNSAWWAEARACLSMPNVHCLGWVSEQDRAPLLQDCDVFLMAHSACRFNLGSCPAKLWDYFAVGKPVVITQNCPEALRFPDLTYPGLDPSAFAEAAAIALAENSPEKVAMRRIEAHKRSATAVAAELKRIVETT
jgi:glycosyltransferase involved in cell wall biosynthesis